jgi:hypothetical protein
MVGYSPLINNSQDIWLNDIPFNYVDDNGCVWTISEIDGWWGLPDVEAEEDERPYTEDGSYFTEGRYIGRNIVVSGNITPRHGQSVLDSDVQVHARDLLNTKLNIVRSLGTFRVNESPDKIAAVQLVGRPLTKIDNLNNTIIFNFQLKAVDPRKYAITAKEITIPLQNSTNGRTYPKTFTYSYYTVDTSNDFEIVNEGSFNTNGIFTIRGPISNPYIVHVDSGKVLGLKIVLGVGDSISLDLDTRKIVLNGTASRKNVLTRTSQWFKIEPGINTLRFRGSQHIPATTGSPELTNLLPNPNATTLSGWTSEQYTGSSDFLVVQTQASRRAGTYTAAASPNTSSSYYLTSSTAGAIRDVGSTGSHIPISSSNEYNYSIWVKATEPGISQVNMGADYYDSTNTYMVSSIESTPVTGAPESWYRFSTILQPPLGAAYASLRASVDAPVPVGSTGTTAYFSDAQLTIGTTLWDYFDGNMAGAYWLGTAYQSSSIKTPVAEVPQAVVEFIYRDAWIE